MTKKQKRKRRAATAGAVVMMLGVLHLSTKDASGDTGQCEIGHANPPIVGPCPPNYVPPTTVLINVTPYKPGEPTLAPPIEGTPVGTPVLPGPPTLAPAVPQVAVDTPTTIIQEDDPRWDCHTMGNKRCGPPHTTKPKLALPATSGAGSQSLPATE